MMQYEISVIIKGRADGNQDKYNQLERPEIALPLITNEDKTFMYMVYENIKNLWNIVDCLILMILPFQH